MTKIDVDILVIAKMGDYVQNQLDARFRTHKLHEAADPDAMIAEIGPSIRGVAAGAHRNVDIALMDQLPNLEIVTNFGVGYDNVDAKSAGARGIIVTNTPDVLSDEVADTAIGLMINAVRELPQAEQFLRAGKWTSGNYPLTQNTLREKRLGIAGLGRIGKSIAKRAESFGLSIAYYGRSDQKNSYTFYDSLKALAENVDIIISVLPGGDATSKVYNKDV
ncbi:MAG: NAD(P)-dependent oxidoreductase, partial [Hyphomicrobiales bacterium]